MPPVRFVVLMSIGIALAGPAATLGQSASPQGPVAAAVAPPKPAIRRPPPRRPSSTVTGTITAIDNASVTIRTASGRTTAYVLLDSSTLYRARKLTDAATFKPGDLVTLRLHKLRGEDTYAASEMADPASEKWLRGLRTKTTTATVKTIGDDQLVATVGSDDVTYSLTDRTVWVKGGAAGTAASFKAGDRIYIVPASRSNGGIHARVVADSYTAALQAKERLGTTLHGNVRTVDLKAGKLSIVTAAGQTRDLAIASDCALLIGKRPVAMAALRPGARVSITIRRGAGDETVFKIVISKGARPRPVRFGAH